MKTQLVHKFEDVVSVENLLLAWQEFVKGKRSKLDVQLFACALIDNILQLHNDLANKTYRHGGYKNFNISDPKPRNISKASVRDRLVHHAVYRILYPFFDKTFIANSYSCRLNKGTHRAINKFRKIFYKVSRNNIKTCWVLKCDIKKFFASINHEVLIKVLQEYIPDQDINWLLQEIIASFSTGSNVGLPLGNLTSQLFVNIYLNEFDQFVKHKLKIRYYMRYADDFVILSDNRQLLLDLVLPVQDFLRNRSHLVLHPDKLFLKAFSSGIDFLGWVNFPDHRVPRATTRRRMLKRIITNPYRETVQSYLGFLKHGNTQKLKSQLLLNKLNIVL